MAATSAVSMAMPLTSSSQKKALIGSEGFLKPSLPLRSPRALSASARRPSSRLVVRASLKEKAAAGLTAGVMTASMLVPQVAEAAGSGVSPSLKNFLLSIVAGGVVLIAIVGAVIGVSTFDPVKRT